MQNSYKLFPSPILLKLRIVNLMARDSKKSCLHHKLQIKRSNLKLARLCHIFSSSPRITAHK